MSNTKKENQQNSAKAKQSKNVPVAGDLNVSTECVTKSVGSSKEVR